MKKMKVLRRLAPALIASGLLLMLTGGQQVRPVSNQPADINYHRELNHLDSQFADMHQYLLQHKACTELGWPDEWPCTRFTPEERVVQD